jgi:hypothetical protein
LLFDKRLFCDICGLRGHNPNFCFKKSYNLDAKETANFVAILTANIPWLNKPSYECDINNKINKGGIKNASPEDIYRHARLVARYPTPFRDYPNSRWNKKKKIKITYSENGRWERGTKRSFRSRETPLKRNERSFRSKDTLSKRNERNNSNNSRKRRNTEVDLDKGRNKRIRSASPKVRYSEEEINQIADDIYTREETNIQKKRKLKVLQSNEDKELFEYPPISRKKRKKFNSGAMRRRYTQWNEEVVEINKNKVQEKNPVSDFWNQKKDNSKKRKKNLAPNYNPNYFTFDNNWDNDPDWDSFQDPKSRSTFLPDNRNDNPPEN